MYPDVANNVPRCEEDLGFPTIPATVAPSSSSGNETPNPIPTPDREGSSVEALGLRIQESLALPNRHLFWETKPVGQFKDLGDASLLEGPIEAPSPLSVVRSDPYNLPASYEWSTIDIDDAAAACTEVYHLLSLHYIEDDDNLFRFNYSQPFLRWALCPSVPPAHRRPCQDLQEARRLHHRRAHQDPRP